MKKLNSKELRKQKPEDGDMEAIKRNPICFVLDNVIDTYNIGSMFRLADAVAAEKVYICGEVEYPPNSRIHKAAVGTEEWVPWEKRDTTIETVKELKTKGYQVISIEQSPDSIPVGILPGKVDFPVALVVGNETLGVSKEVLDYSDVTVELPMFGVNKSLNVWGSAAVGAYKLIETLILKPYFPKKKTKV